MATLWLYPGKGGWHFVTLPQELAADLDYIYADRKRGWGSLPVEVTVGTSVWKTSIFTDKKSESSILPVKKAVRKAEGLGDGSKLEITLRVLV